MPTINEHRLLYSSCSVTYKLPVSRALMCVCVCVCVKHLQNHFVCAKVQLFSDICKFICKMLHNSKIFSNFAADLWQRMKVK